MLKQARDLYCTLKCLFSSPTLSVLSPTCHCLHCHTLFGALKFAGQCTRSIELCFMSSSRKKTNTRQKGSIPFIKVSLTCICLIHEISTLQFLCFLTPTYSLYSCPNVQVYEQNCSLAEGENDHPSSLSGCRHPMYDTGKHKSLCSLTRSSSKAYFLSADTSVPSNLEGMSAPLP